MQDGITFTTFRRLEELREAVPAWNALWMQDQDATPFQCPEWLLPWARQFASPELRAVMVYERGSPVALLPFYRHLDPQTGERQLLLLGSGTSDYLDGTYSPGCTPAHVRAGLSIVCGEDDWDALCVFQLRENSKLRSALAPLQFPGMRRANGESCSRFPAVPLTGLPRSMRDQVRYYRNRAARKGQLELAIANENSWSRAFADLERLHTSRWHSSGQPGLLADPRVVAWHREALPLLLRRGLLRLYTLSLDGEAIAVLYSLIDRPRRRQHTEYFYLTAFSIQHADLRPGTVLMALAVEHAEKEGAETIDLLRGDEPYKRLWHPQRIPTFGFSMPYSMRSASMLDDMHIRRAAA